jgi:hypothetical protein
MTPAPANSLSTPKLAAMDDKRQRKPTTPEEEGIELHPDAWERFERTFHKVVKAPPVHRTGKTIAGDQPKRKGRGRARDKSNA